MMARYYVNNNAQLLGLNQTEININKPMYRSQSCSAMVDRLRNGSTSLSRVKKTHWKMRTKTPIMLKNGCRSNGSLTKRIFTTSKMVLKSN